VPQAAILEAVNQVVEQRQRQEQGHHSGLAELQWRLFSPSAATVRAQ
jgi:hypothetical protein